MPNKSPKFTVLLLTAVVLSLFSQASDDCVVQYREYPGIREYSLRFRDKIESHGCGVVGLYGELVKIGVEEDVLNLLDDNPNLIPPLQTLLKNKKCNHSAPRPSPLK